MFVRSLSRALPSTIVCVCACTPNAPVAPEPRTNDVPDASSPTPIVVDDISALLETHRANGLAPAVAAAVWRGGQLIANGVAGVRKAGDPTLATLTDKWHLGSNTKAMTATLIGKYVDRGKLRFDDTIGKLFAGEKVDPAYVDVTLLQLLQHRGGAPENPQSEIWTAMWANATSPSYLRTAVLDILALPATGTKGTYAYSNTGYVIAGAALERATGELWETLIKRDLFDALEMSSCGFGSPGRAGVVEQPWGHKLESANKVVFVMPGLKADNPRPFGPAGTVHCALEDWGKFLNLHLAGARGDAFPYVTRETLLQLQTPPKDGKQYAAGWDYESKSAFGHSGTNTMWYARNVIIPTKNLVVVAATNILVDAPLDPVDPVIDVLRAKYE